MYGDEAHVSLNMVDFLHLATSDINLSHANLITVRFCEYHSPVEIRAAMRLMVSTYPKLRSVVEPALLSYRLAILDDETPRVDVLFDDAFRVETKVEYDSEQFIEARRDLYNEPFALGVCLPLKIRFFPDGNPPVLLVAMHHVVSDGASWIHMLDSLMMFLNKKMPDPVPIDNPAIHPVIFPDGWKARASCVLSSIAGRVSIPGKKSCVIPSSPRKAGFYGPVDIHHFRLARRLDDVKKAAKRYGCSLNTFFLGAVVRLFAGRNPGMDNARVVIALPVDLRQFYKGKKPVFGNYLSGMEIPVPAGLAGDPPELFAAVQEMVTSRLEDIKKRRNPPLELAAGMLIGRKLYSKAIKKVITSANRTCGVSNIGNLDHVNSHGDKARVLDAISCAPSCGLLIVFDSTGEGITSKISFQVAEFSRDEIEELARDLEKTIGELVDASW